MATDGAEFKRRVKYHGKTYVELKKGSSLEVVAGFSVAGLARELAGENPIFGLSEMVKATVDCLQGILARDGQSLLQDLHCRLSQIAARSDESESQRICMESLVRAAGALRGNGSVLDSSVITDKILAACGRDLHDALVIRYADQYAMTHRGLIANQLPDFLDAINIVKNRSVQPVFFLCLRDRTFPRLSIPQKRLFQWFENIIATGRSVLLVCLTE